VKRSIPSLDGLRAISISFVLVAHLTGTKNFFPIAGVLELPRFGTFGVHIFFIISGYLITSLLLRELTYTETIRLGPFYFRRAMRLFPAAYVMLAVVAAVTTVSRADVLAGMTYTMNYRFGLNSRPGWSVGHLWSLAVEEQFYLLWPFLLSVLHSRRAVKLLSGCLVVGPIARYALLHGWAGASLQFLIYSDALATGCLLALLREQLWNNHYYRRVLQSKWFFCIPLLAVAMNYAPGFRVMLLQTAVNIAIAMTIDWAIRNEDSAPGRVLNLGPVRAIGVLSYSIYLWQEAFLNRGSSSVVCAFPLNILLTLGAATMSYYAVEQPFLRLRARFEKAGTTPAPQVTGMVGELQ
jgi:peptidoglycan/LPS O-acetylase OafA/YrhL